MLDKGKWEEDRALKILNNVKGRKIEKIKKKNVGVLSSKKSGGEYCTKENGRQNREMKILDSVIEAKEKKEKINR